MGCYRETVFPRLLEWASGDPALDALRRITAVDPNPGMAPLARRRMQSTGIEVEHHLITAERLPFDSNSFDCVVSTLTPCFPKRRPGSATAIWAARAATRTDGDPCGAGQLLQPKAAADA
jgi:hypothetical protein